MNDQGDPSRHGQMMTGEGRSKNNIGLVVVDLRYVKYLGFPLVENFQA